jgi:hypothetical protein
LLSLCRCYNNAYFAKVGGISLPEMNYLEVDFLFAVGFDLNVSPETFGRYCAVLQSKMLCLDLQATPAGGPRLLPQDVCCLSEDDGATTTTTSSSCKQQLAA